jgi:hypothetical protein
LLLILPSLSSALRERPHFRCADERLPPK